MSQLLTHCGSRRCSIEQLLTVPQPDKTQSYTPLNHYDFAINVLTVASDLLKDYRFDGDQYALSSDGAKMFGIITYHKHGSNGQQDLRLCLGLRNSYDKSMSVGLTVGASVIVCDNLMFRGDITVLRKHTGENLHEELHEQIITAIYKSQHQFSCLSEDALKMKQTPMIRREKYQYLGVLTGERILSPTQSTKAFREIRKPTHEEFRADSVWAAYNCATEALKSCPPQHMITRHARLHELTHRLYLN